MKRRRVEQAERRKPTVELNLVGEVKSRSAAASRGCASLLSRLIIDAVLLLLVGLGLS